MKITLSKPKEGEKRHVVLLATAEEHYEVYGIIRTEILGRTIQPRIEWVNRRTQVRYRFAMKYLEPLMLTFPFSEFSPGLENRLTKQAKRELDLMQVPDLDLPNFRGNLHDFQKIAVAKMLSRKRFLLNDELGLGKSYQACAAIDDRLPCLIVVPNSIKYNWERILHETTDYDVQVLDGSAAQRAKQIERGADVLIINVEALRIKAQIRYDPHPDLPERKVQRRELIPVNPGLFDIEWQMAIVDEYHRFKNHAAQQTQGLHRLNAKVKVGMSGTPLLNGRPEEIWSILHWMYPKRFPTFYEFERKHCIKMGNKVTGYRGLHEVRDFFQKRSLRRRKEHVNDQLPDVVYADHYIDLTTEQRRLYNQIRDELLIWVEEEPRKIVNMLAQMTRLKQACFSPELYEGSKTSAKIEEVKRLVKELTDSGEKALIFSQWSKATRILQRELEHYNPAYIDGTVPVKDRMEQIDKFNNDEDCKVFIGTIGACREGFTLGAATYVIFTDKGWTPAENEQAAGRSAAGGLRGAGRAGQTVHIIEIKANDTIEEYIEELLKKKKIMNDRMTERDAGSKVERINMTDIRSLLER